ncbi:MAG: hypothetical protein IT577_22520 [Verrucomicrobiae bacterium]|nr:hypothetical protein [Verrucomicrobiae bacterium]
MRRELRFLAAGVAALVLTAQVVNWRGVSVNTATGIANVTGIAFYGGVTGAQFVGGGGGLTGVLKPPDTNGFVRGSITNGLAAPDTNWWLVFEIDLRGWTDGTLQLSTNGFLNTDAPDYSADAIVFRWTSSDCRLNGSPSWERFETNWYPLAIMTFNAPHDSRYGWLTIGIRNSAISFTEWIENLWGPTDSPMVATDKMIVYVRQPAAWFHPTNRVGAIFLRQGATGEERSTNFTGETMNVGPRWQSIDPKWVQYDPRPRRVNILLDDPPNWGWQSIGAQHSQP